MTVQIDHKAQAQSRIYGQYRDKPKFVEWIGINGEIGNEFEPVLFDVSESYDIDAATTHELDVLGNIVVLNRSFESELAYVATQVGSAQVGGSQLTAATGTVDQALSNAVFRLLIRAKIVKNNGDATLDGIIEALRFVVETDDIQIRDNEDMTFDVVFGVLTDLEREVLTKYAITPKPQGVRVRGFFEGNNTPQYGRSQYGNAQYAYGFTGP